MALITAVIYLLNCAAVVLWFYKLLGWCLNAQEYFELAIKRSGLLIGLDDI
jgi:hypothetical protein